MSPIVVSGGATPFITNKILPLGTPRLSLSLPAFIRFLGAQIIASADELEAEKQPVEAEASNEPETQESTEKEVTTTVEPKEEEPQTDEGDVAEEEQKAN